MKLGHALALAGFVVAGLVSGAGAAPVPYTGNWINDTFGSTGPASASLDLTGGALTLVFDLDNGPGGSVLGQPVDPGPVTIAGTSNPDTSVTVNSITPNPHPVYGSIAAIIASPSNATITMTEVPNPGITGVTMTGGVTSPTTLGFNYTVGFVGGGSAVGRILLTQVPEPSVASAIAGATLLLARRRRG